MTRRDWVVVIFCLLIVLVCLTLLVSPAQGQTVAPRGQDRGESVPGNSMDIPQQGWTQPTNWGGKRLPSRSALPPLSIFVLAAASAADLASSVGHYEANPLARGADGRFSLARGIVLKASYVAGITYIQHKVPWRGWKYVNFAAATQALPDPDAASGKLYRFFFGFTHTLAGNIALVRKQLRNGEAPPPVA